MAIDMQSDRNVPGENGFEPELLDLHLGVLSSGRYEQVLAKIAADPALAAQHEALGSVFAALASLRTEAEFPLSLTDRIIERVRQAAPPLRLVKPAASRPGPNDGGFVVRSYNLRDVLAIAASIILVVGLGVPSVLKVRERDKVVMCSANLAQLGQGLAAYAAAFNNSLPFAGWRQNASWQPSSDPAIEAIPNRRHVYPLLHGGMVRDPARFVCPSQWHVPMPADQVRSRNDFPSSRNLSYTYQNMSGIRPNFDSDRQVPIIADENPLFEDGLPLGLSFGASANSRSHGGTGQNVLTLEGRVKWMDTPDCGVDGDNIWTLQGASRYTGREGPSTSTDSHLLK